MKTRSYEIVGLLVLASACSRNAAVSYTGFVDATTSDVATQMAGRVQSIAVHAGDRVAQGQLLAELDSREAQAQVSEAQANLERSQAGLAQAQQDMHAALPTVKGAGADILRAQASLDEAQLSYNRTKSLVDEHVQPQSQLDSADARLREAKAALQSLLASKETASSRVQAAVAAVSVAQAQVHASQAALDAAQVRLSETKITAPFAGLVVQRNLEPGEWAAPGTPVVTVEDRSRLWVRVDIEETKLGGLKVGAPAQIQVIALPDKTFTGHVSEVGAEGEFALNQDVKRGRPDIRTFRVKVAFDHPVDALRPGMTAEVRLGPSS